MPALDLDALYRTHARMVYWTAYGVVKNDPDAMDVSQDVFLRALRHGDKLAGMNEKQQRAWLYRVAMNLCMDQKRREKRVFPTEVETFFEEETTDTADLPEPSALSKEQREALRAAIDALPDIYRQTVLLHYFSGLGYAEIASLSGSTEGTVKSRMSRAKARLYASLTQGGEMRV